MSQQLVFILDILVILSSIYKSVFHYALKSEDILSHVLFAALVFFENECNAMGQFMTQHFNTLM